MICPDEHTHAAKTTCYHKHGCRCDDCVTTALSRQRARRKNQAYGRHQPMVSTLGVQRRLQGLQVLGWRYKDVGDVMGVTAKRVHTISQRTDRVTPRVHALVVQATRVLVARGAGPSKSTANRAKAQGWVSLFAWNDIDRDTKPVGTVREKKREGTLRGEELFAEIVWLAEDGAPAHQIAASVGKRLDTLEKYVRRHHRDDLLVHLKERKAA